MTRRGPVVFAGGGTGGHVFPGLAVLERLREQHPDALGIFAVSERPLDARILAETGVAWVPLPAVPPPRAPWRWPGFGRRWRESVKRAEALLRHRRAVAVLATGGFVAAPTIRAAVRVRVPVGLLELDAVPGKALRLARWAADRRFAASRGGVPLRRAAVGPDPGAARAALGFPGDRPLLFVSGGSQGARSVNEGMAEVLADPAVAEALAGWGVLHLCGDRDPGQLENAYAAAGVPARVERFRAEIGSAWAAADLAVARAGAGSVAEAWANATPTLFLPYPFHRDRHQAANARPLVEAGAARLVADPGAGPRTARLLAPSLRELLPDPSRRQAMRSWLRDNPPPDCGDAAADWLGARLSC